MSGRPSRRPGKERAPEAEQPQNSSAPRRQPRDGQAIIDGLLMGEPWQESHPPRRGNEVTPLQAAEAPQEQRGWDYLCEYWGVNGSQLFLADPVTLCVRGTLSCEAAACCVHLPMWQWRIPHERRY